MRAPIIWGLLLAVFLGVPPAAAGGEGGLLDGYRAQRSAWGTLYLRDRASGAGEMERAPAEIAASLARVEARLGRARGRPFTVILTPGAEEFNRVFGLLAGRRPASWIAGVAFPSRDLLIVRGEVFAVLRRPGERPAAVLAHELAHLVIHRSPGTRVPRWIDEGAAMWVSGQVLDPDDEALLSGLARLGALRALETLDEEFPESHDLATLAYQESLLLIEWLAARSGPHALSDLLDALEAGVPASDAVTSTAGLARADLTPEFRKWVAGRRALWEVLVHGANLWTLTSLLAILAIVRGVRRRRRLLKRMEEAETLEAEGSSWG